MAVGLDRHGPLALAFEPEAEGDVVMRHFLQEQGLAHEIAGVFRAENGLGQPREGRKFVDHLPEVADLADDRRRQLLEQFRISLDLAAVAALETLGRELDRGERVLDLVRDAAGNVGPCGAALIEQLAGDVLEGDDMAIAVSRDLDRQREQIAAGGIVDNAAAFAARDELGQLGCDIR